MIQNQTIFGQVQSEATIYSWNNSSEGLFIRLS